MSYILAGTEILDSKAVAERWYQLFGKDTLLICGGSKVNWTFLQQGTVDEWSLLIVPVADGSLDSVIIFEKSVFLSESMLVEFQLKNIEQLKSSRI